jgi:hypothetical protein
MAVGRSLCPDGPDLRSAGRWGRGKRAMRRRESVLLVLVLTREDGQLSDVDDPSKTLRLSDFNRRYMSTVTHKEKTMAEASLGTIAIQDEQENLLLKSLKELRLVLRMCLVDQGWG